MNTTVLDENGDGFYLHMLRLLVGAGGDNFDCFGGPEFRRCDYMDCMWRGMCKTPPTA